MAVEMSRMAFECERELFKCASSSLINIAKVISGLAPDLEWNIGFRGAQSTEGDRAVTMPSKACCENSGDQVCADGMVIGRGALQPLRGVMQSWHLL